MTDATSRTPVTTASAASPPGPPAGLPTTQAGPLAGLKVLQLGQLIAGPFAGKTQADFGAEVIKIEPPAGDTTRALVRGGPSGTIVAYSHSKKAICLDLTTEGGKAVFRKLVASADSFSLIQTVY